jgi:hypothetical protein
VSTYDLYTTSVTRETWDVPAKFRAQEVWERLGFDVAECLEFTEHSEMQQASRALLFSRIVPCVKAIGLRGEKVQRAYTDLGVLDAARATSRP